MSKYDKMKSKNSCLNDKKICGAYKHSVHDAKGNIC